MVKQVLEAIPDSHKTTKAENALYERFRQIVDTNIRANIGPMFSTSVENLFDIFLDNLPEDRRAHYNCNSCRKFFNTYGSLVSICEGQLIPFVWNNMPDSMGIFQASIVAMRYALVKSKITGQFLFDNSIWGTPVTGKWSHFCATSAHPNHTDRLLTPSQKMAEKREDFRILSDALKDFGPALLDQAIGILRSDALARSQKFLGTAEKIRALQAAFAETKDHRKRNALIWETVATAPAGFCHLRSSVLGLLLKDIKDELPFNEIQARFNAALHPLQYQRPTSAPKAGNIDNAEKIIEQLGLKDSLRRRYATIEDMHMFWTPPMTEPRSRGGVFDKLREAKSEPAVSLPTATMSFVKFQRDVLPHAASIEIFVPFERLPFITFMAPADPNAKQIVSWDNGVSWYFRHGGNTPSEFNLRHGWHRVIGLCERPNRWNRAADPRNPEQVTLLIENCRPVERTTSSCLFPEILISDLHQIRHTIEAFSNKTPAEGDTARAVGGLEFRGRKVRVTNKFNQAQVYILDRWE